MPEQEKWMKVIKGLECCNAYDYKCNDCPYQDDGGAEDGCYSDELKADALALLKAQEPRLVTEADFDGADEYGYLPVWVEYKDGEIICDCITKTAITDPDKDYCYRFWTSKPTEAQREATQWTAQS